MSIAETIKDSKLDTDILEVEALCKIGDIEPTDKGFENELLYYGQDSTVQIASDVNTYYHQATSSLQKSIGEVKQAEPTLKAALNRISSTKESISTSAEQIKNSWKRYKQAKKEHKLTLPFSKEAKRAKETMRDCKTRISSLNRTRHQRQKSIEESKATIATTKAKISESKANIEKATRHRDEIIKRVREQFKIADKIKAAYESAKYQLDPNVEPIGGNSDKLKTAKNFTEQLKGKSLKISLLSPLKDVSVAQLTADPNEKADPIVLAYANFNNMFKSPQDLLLSEKFYLEGQHAKNSFIKQIQTLSLDDNDRSR